MKFFTTWVCSFVLVIFCPVIIYAQEKPVVNVPLVLVANQALEVGLSEESPSNDPVVNQELPLKVEIVPVIANQQIPADSTLTIESKESSVVKALTFPDRGPLSRIKQLAGRWEGLSENTPGQKQDKIAVVYEVTAGGSVVMERIFPGSSQEMVTMYYEEKGQLTLTHYCMIGTRSVMRLKIPEDLANQQQKNIYEFSLVESPGLDPTVDTHMHSLKISFIDESHMNQSWEMFEAGKLSGSYSFVLTRVSNNP